MRQHGDEQFYAIYYTTEFKFIGRGDAFIAPSDGTYTFKLWGSPGGIPYNYSGYSFNHNSNRGGYVQVDVPLRRNQKLFCFVGSAGNPGNGLVISGGYNGGAGGITHAGTHSASGGGATHISWSYNPIYSDTFDTNPANGVPVRSCIVDIYGMAPANYYIHFTHRWDNLQDVVAVAGGAGGEGLVNPDTHSSARYQTNSYGGGNVSCPAITQIGQVRTAANNNTGAGYARGAGECGFCDSCGGGGWYSGYSPSRWYGACFGGGGGGTSYVRGDYISNSLNIPGNDLRLLTTYVKPVTEGRNGYIKVTKK